MTPASGPVSGALASAQLASATAATYVAFASVGFAFASWAARIPQVQDRLGLDPARLGVLLLAVSGGSVIALPLSGPMVMCVGSRRTVAASAMLTGIGLITVSIGYRLGVTPVVAGLFVFGLAIGSWDVAVNVQGASVERRHGRSMMPRFHAGFSIGTVAGALLGTSLVALGVSVAAHLAAVGILVGVGVPLPCSTSFPIARHETPRSQRGRPRGAGRLA
jgi:fucose permease